MFPDQSAQNSRTWRLVPPLTVEVVPVLTGILAANRVDVTKVSCGADIQFAGTQTIGSNTVGVLLSLLPGSRPIEGEFSQLAIQVIGGGSGDDSANAAASSQPDIGRYIDPLCPAELKAQLAR